NGISSVTVNGANASGGTASGSGTASWSATVMLVSGVNTITVVAKDTLNNSTQKVVSVTFNPPAQQLTWTSMSNGILSFVLNGPVGSNYVIHVSSNLVNWVNWVTNVIPSGGVRMFDFPISPTQPQLFYRALLVTAQTQATNGMALIPAGSFTMGDTFSEGFSYELPLHTVYVSAFYMDKYDVTKSLWDSVYQWAINHGYNFDNPGSGKAANHPVQTIDWYDC